MSLASSITEELMPLNASLSFSFVAISVEDTVSGSWGGEKGGGSPWLWVAFEAVSLGAISSVCVATVTGLSFSLLKNNNVC